MLGMTFYRVDTQIIPSQLLTKEQHRESLTEAGLMIKKESIYTSSADDPTESNESDFTHLHMILAEKMSHA